jgi:hypothetical protein
MSKKISQPTTATDLTALDLFQMVDVEAGSLGSVRMPNANMQLRW